MLRKLYIVLALFVVGWYSYSTAVGMEYFHEPREKLPEEVKSSPGGYRGHHVFFIYGGGFGGGK